MNSHSLRRTFVRTALTVLACSALLFGPLRAAGAETPPDIAEDTVEPAPRDTPEPAPRDTPEPAPRDTAEPAPQDSLEPAPDDRVEPRIERCKIRPCLPSFKPKAAVALGDSFVSGEGAGSYQPVTNQAGVAQSFPGWTAGNDNAFFCHRSANASIEQASLPGITARFNLACSGGQPHDMTNPSSARANGRDVDAQIDQLLEVAQTHNIELVLVGLGSNNSSFTFGDAAANCAERFISDAYIGWWEFWAPGVPQDPCNNNDLATSADLAAAEAETLNAVRAIVEALDPVDDDYRLVLQSYTNPLPYDLHSSFHSEDGRDDERDKFRALARERYAAGCPIHRDSLGPAHWFSGSLGHLVNGVRGSLVDEFPDHDIVYLDVQKAFNGDRLCERSNSPTGALATPVRLMNGNSLGTHVTSLSGYNKVEIRDELVETCTDHYQTCQESWHPNAAGHAVLGECLAAAWTTSAPTVECNRSSGSTVAIDRYPTLQVNLNGWWEAGGPTWILGSWYTVTLLHAGGATIDSVTVTPSAVGSGVTVPGPMSGTSGYFDVIGPCATTQPNVSIDVQAVVDGQTMTGSASYWDPDFTDCWDPGHPK